MKFKLYCNNNLYLPTLVEIRSLHSVAATDAYKLLVKFDKVDAAIPLFPELLRLIDLDFLCMEPHTVLYARYLLWEITLIQFMHA